MNVITRSKNYALYSNKANSHVRMYVTQGEYATTLATFTLYNGDTVFNLTGISASSILCSVYLTNSINRAVTLPVTVTDAAAGKITVATTQELSATYDGEGFDCYVQVVSTQNAVTKFSGMKIYVQADPTLDLIAQSPNAQTLIDALNKLALIDGGTGTIDIDDDFSLSSSNPIQNKKITQKLNEIDGYLSGYSFLYDAYGRIFSYTDSTNINTSSFENKDLVTSSNKCYVWLSKNVVNVQTGALPDAGNIIRIYYEGANASQLTLASEYGSVAMTVGRSNRSVFYLLATVAYLFNNTLKTGYSYSKSDSDNRYRKTADKITLSDLATTLANLINGKADSSDLANKLDDIIGSVKTSNINDYAVTEVKLATALADKINGKINSANAIKYAGVNDIDNCTEQDTLYRVYCTDINNVTGYHYLMCVNGSNTNRSQYLFSQRGTIQYRTRAYSSGAWQSWGDWIRVATTADTTALSSAIEILNTALTNLSTSNNNKIPKSDGAVIEEYINDHAVTETKLSVALATKINGKLNSSDGVKFVNKSTINECNSFDTIYRYYGTDLHGLTTYHMVLCIANADSYSTQVLLSANGFIQYRTKSSSGTYGDWKELATTTQTSLLSSSISALRSRVSTLEENSIQKSQGSVIEEYINNGAVTKNKLAPALKAELDDKLSTTSGVIFVNSQNANECLAQNTLYVLQTEIDGHIQNTHTLICSKDIDNRAQYRFSVDGGFEYRTQEGLVQEGNPWSEWKAFATSGALSDVATSLSENYYTITQIDNALNVINTAISNLNSTVEFKANKVSDIDSSTYVATAEETQYPSVGAIKRLVNSQIYRKVEIDTQLGTHIHNAELWYGLPVTVGFDNYKIPVAVIEGNLINKSMISNNSITTLYIAANVTDVANDILDGSNIATIYVDMDYNDGAILLENVEGLENVDNVYYKDGNYNFNKYLAKALAYIRSLIVNLNGVSQRIEAKADTATTYGISVVLDSSDWNNNLQSVDISSLYTVTQNTDIKINISDTVYSQLDSCGCESICVNAELVNDSYILKFEVEGRAPATNITVDLLLTEVVNLS